MHPKIRQLYDQGSAINSCFFCRFYIQGRVMDSFEIQTTRIAWDETKWINIYDMALGP